MESFDNLRCLIGDIGGFVDADYVDIWEFDILRIGIGDVDIVRCLHLDIGWEGRLGLILDEEGMILCWG